MPSSACGVISRYASGRRESARERREDFLLPRKTATLKPKAGLSGPPVTRSVTLSVPLTNFKSKPNFGFTIE